MGLEPPAGAQYAGTLWLDNVSLFKTVTLFDFQAGIPAGFGAFADSWDGSGSSTALSLGHTAVVEPRVPAIADNMGLVVTYTIAAAGGWGGGPGYGGVTHPFTQAQDWSDNFAFGFWMQGSNSGLNHRIELKSQGPNAGAANLWQYTFADDFSGWKHFMVPFADFVKRTDYNPGAALGDSIDLAVMWGYSLLLEPGSAGAFYLDDVTLFGKPVDSLKAAFTQASKTIDEGSAVTLTVSLNITSANQVRWICHGRRLGQCRQRLHGCQRQVTIPAGELAADVVINTTDDGDVEGNETFGVILSNPVNAALTSQVTATVTIKDNDQAPPVEGGHSVIVDSYEYTTGLPTGVDSNNVGIGFVTWNAPGASAGIALTVPGTQPPGKPAGNQVMQLNLNLGAGQWGGFTHAFENAAVDTWVSQDWSAYEGVSFWLYGNNTGSIIFVDIQDNRTPGSTKDDAERWSVDIPDDFTGWRFFQIPFSQFNRKDIGNGAPFDGFGKTEIWGYAFGGFDTISNQSYFIDDFGLIPRTTLVDDYELANLPSGVDSNNVGIGFVTWNAPGASAGITLTVPGVQPPGKPPATRLCRNLNLGAGQWGGFTHAFENAAVDTWVSQDWSSYEGICFWLFGNNTGSIIFVDIQDNRTPGSTKDDAERWSTDIPDDFTGWRFFQSPSASSTARTSAMARPSTASARPRSGAMPSAASTPSATRATTSTTSRSMATWAAAPRVWSLRSPRRPTRLSRAPRRR